MENEIDRRSFLIKLSVGLGALAAAVISVPVVSAVLEPVLRKQKTAWRNVGAVSDFAIGSTTLVTFRNASDADDGSESEQSASWLRRESDNRFIAFSANCTHLGCPVRWEESPQLFMCPCHGGIYHKDGSVAAGPPPKSLIQYPVRISGAQVEIQTSPIPLTKITA